MNPVVVSLLVLVVIVFLLWFAVGTQGNIRRGNRFLAWFQDGLPVLGRKTTMRWLGSSAVELKITEPARPFRSAEALVVLEPRDLGWLWAIARARGRRDFIILRARLDSSPRFELEAGDPNTWTGRDRLKLLDPEAWHTQEWGVAEVAHTHDADVEGMRKIWSALEGCTGGVWRMSIRRDNPHIELHVAPPDVASVGSRPIFEQFLSLANSVRR
jgi:hypothetical protein